MTPRRCVMPPRAERWRRAAGGLVLAAATALAACGAPPPRPPSPAQELARTANERAARALQRGDLARARALYASALDAAQALQDPALTGTARLNLALVDARRGDAASAMAQVDAVLAATPPPDPALQARAAARKALLLVDAGDLDGALGWTARARVSCPSPCTLAPVLDNLDAFVALQRGDAASALRLARRAAEQAGAVDQPGEQASALRLAGRAATQLGDTGAAADALARALAIDREIGQSDRIALDLLFAADNEDRRGNAALAADYERRALTVYTAIGDTRNAQVVQARLARR